jgi:hypothetical protein
MSGAVVFSDRGGCAHQTKALLAQASGALVLVNLYLHLLLWLLFVRLFFAVVVFHFCKGAQFLLLGVALFLRIFLHTLTSYA